MHLGDLYRAALRLSRSAPDAEGRFRVKPLLTRFMLEHIRGLKAKIEERAKRSRVFQHREDCESLEQGGET